MADKESSEEQPSEKYYSPPYEFTVYIALAMIVIGLFTMITAIATPEMWFLPISFIIGGSIIYGASMIAAELQLLRKKDDEEE